jgi:CTP:molybdopterin cytidylyltransferase MocA
MNKRTVALLLARGAMNGAPPLHECHKYKALVPINGVPMVDYVLSALQASAAEKIFVVQGIDEGLEQAVGCHSKNAFINCESNGSSYSHSLFSGLIKLADYYGPDELCKIEIMLVPCDIPLADSGNFNRLIAANDDKNTDVCTCLIRSELLKGRYPERKFPRFYCSDLGENYCMQNFAFISGRTLAVCLYGASLAREWHSRSLPSTLMADFATKADNLVSLRQTHLVIPLIVRETFWWLAREGSVLQAIQMLGKLLFRRCTTQDFKKFVFLASGLNADYIDSQEAELSFDVDQSEHLDALSDLKPRWSVVGSTT